MSGRRRGWRNGCDARRNKPIAKRVPIGPEEQARGRLVVRAPQLAWRHFIEERARHGVESLPVSEQGLPRRAALFPRTAARSTGC
ncbi:MAG TPA: hypothetical protein VNK45_04605 [Candidatus Acidoferrales bacterium]|nr:hypothetical protein [Candidatus Acidoferrales bacterium]